MKKVVLVVLVAVLVAVGFAYAAANTVPVTGAGDGNEAISGYEVTNVHYILDDDNNPATIDRVTFTITPITTGVPAPTTVKITLKDESTTWHPCTSTDGGSSWTCSVGGAVTVSDADQLRVVAAQ